MSSRFAPVRTFLARFLIALVVGSLLMAGVVAGVDREIAHKVDRIPKINLSTAKLPPEGANYLLVGVDNTGGVTGEFDDAAFGDRSKENNTDTIMVVHLEPRAERAIIVSFPRDMFVNIPGHGRSKINAAFSYGPQTLIDTLQQNFGIDIHHYIELNFLSFVGLVNKLGPVQVYVPYKAQDEYTGFGVPQGGCWPMDGEQALQWVRTRYLQYWDDVNQRWVAANDIAPDLSRIGRQQEFMRTLAGLAVGKSMGDPLVANWVADEIVRNLRVDDEFDKNSIFDLVDAFRTLSPEDTSALQFQTMPTRAGKERIGSTMADVLYPLMDQGGSQLVQRLNTFDTRPRQTPPPGTVHINVVDASGRENLALAVKNTLQELGFLVNDAVTTAPTTQEGSSIKYNEGQLDKSKLLLRYIEPVPNVPVGASTVVDADLQLTVGRNFQSVAVPADALTPTTTTLSPEQVAENGIVDVPLEFAAPPPDVVLPNPAPRVGC